MNLLDAESTAINDLLESLGEGMIVVFCLVCFFMFLHVIENMPSRPRRKDDEDDQE